MFNWLKLWPVYLLLSGSVLLTGGYFLATFGLRPGLDFTGGSLLELKVAASLESVRAETAAVVEAVNIQQSSDQTYIFRSAALDSTANQVLQSRLEDKFGPVEEVRFETIGPVLGRELIKKTLIGLGMAVMFILVYLAYRFRDKTFGICAVLAILHDSLVILGAFSFFGANFGTEIDSLFVTALLTVLSFSVHDTIVLYDRIREDRRLYPKEDFVTLANRAISETMARSVNNSLTIIFMLASLLIFGGETIRWFVTALLIGTISGTYSSPFVAVPLLVLFKRR